MRPYILHPALCGDRVIFVTDDDLWSLDLGTDRAHRLTSLRSAPSHLRPSPDGQWIAFIASEEGGRDVYICPAQGGSAQRLTFEGHVTTVAGWSADSSEVWFSTTARSPFVKWSHLVAAPLDGGDIRSLQLGPGVSVAMHPNGTTAIGRHLDDTARWKRYRGGRMGQIWISDDGQSDWSQAPQTGGNLANPMWLNNRLWFVSDHEGSGNLYSSEGGRGQLRKETHHEDFYVRFPHSDGTRVVYGFAGEMWLIDQGEPRQVPVQVGPSATWAQRRFFTAQRFTESIDLHPKGHAALLTVRGQALSMDLWEGAPRPLPSAPTGRRRLATHLSDASRVAYISDCDGEDRLEVQEVKSGTVRRFSDLDLGIPKTLVASPKNAHVALTNQRHELWMVDLDSGEAHRIDQADGMAIMGVDWSPDGRWLAYGRPHGRRTSRCSIHLWNVKEKTSTAVTDGRSFDWSPTFDPDGHYLYFLGHRDLDPSGIRSPSDMAFPEPAVHGASHCRRA